MVTKIFEKAYERNSSGFVVLQVGANDGVTNDPLHEFIKQRTNIGGVLIEPQQDVFLKLKKNYEGTGMKLENCAVADGQRITMYRIKKSHRETIKQNYNGQDCSGLTCINRQQLINFLKTRNYRFYAKNNIDDFIEPLKVHAKTFEQILKKHNITHVDLLVIDAEGMDCELVTKFMATGIRPQVIYFEHKHCAKEMPGVLSLLRGYHITKDKGNTCAYL